MRFATAPLSTAALLVVVAGSSLEAAARLAWGGQAASAGLLLYFALELPRAGRAGKVMSALAAVAAVAAWRWLPDPGPRLAAALHTSAALAGLFTALGFLREAAESSPLIRDCGALMVRQPPGRRYLVLSLGSHLVALVLNFGVLSLLGAMVVRGNTAEAAGGDLQVVAIRRQRMMSALLRGFTVMTAWSPLSVAFAVVQNVVPGLPVLQLVPLQLGLAGLQLGLGWLLDRLSFPRRAAGAAGSAGWAPLVRLSLLVAAVMVSAVAVAEGLGLRPVMGAVLVVPPAALVWLAVQHRQQGAVGAVLNAVVVLARRLTVTLPAMRSEITMLAAAMFAGSMVAAFLSPQATARAVGALGLPPVVLSVLLAWGVMAAAQLGISQLLTVTLLGGALADLARLGIHPLVLASGLLGAWGLSACTTTVGAAVLTVARLSGVPVRTVARDWNGRYVVLGALQLAAWMVALHFLVPA